MIFVPVGSAHQPFTRLLDAMDALAPGLGEPVVMQAGFSGYQGRNTQCEGYITFGRVHNYMREATLVVGQASTGAVLMSRQYGKPLIVVPRDAVRNESIDDHQFQTVRSLDGRSRMVEVVYEVENLEAAIRRAQAKAREGMTYEADPERDRLLAAIRAAVEGREIPA